MKLSTALRMRSWNTTKRTMSASYCARRGGRRIGYWAGPDCTGSMSTFWSADHGAQRSWAPLARTRSTCIWKGIITTYRWPIFEVSCVIISGDPFFISPFTPKSDQFQISPAASPEILHHTVWRTWLSIAYSDERWLIYCQYSLQPHLYCTLLWRLGRFSLKYHPNWRLHFASFWYSRV